MYNNIIVVDRYSYWF